MNTEQSTKIHAGAQPIGANMMKIDATWDKEAGSLVATTPIGCKITMATTDHLLDSGKIPGPMDLFVSALAGCVVFEINEIMINKDQIDVKEINVKINGIRRPTPPTLFDTLHITITMTGKIDKDYTDRVIQEIITRNCPVAATFGRASYLTWELIIIPS